MYCTTNLWSSLTAATSDYRIFLYPPAIFIISDSYDRYILLNLIHVIVKLLRIEAYLMFGRALFTEAKLAFEHIKVFFIFIRVYYRNYIKMIHTLQAFCKGSKNEDLKSLTEFPREVPLHSATKQDAISIRRCVEMAKKMFCKMKIYGVSLLCFLFLIPLKKLRKYILNMFKFVFFEK